MTTNDRVVVVGAGFGGLKATQLLARAGVDVLLLDRNPYHTFTPLLYQVATGLLSPHQVVYPVRRALQKYPNAEFIQTAVGGIDFADRVVKTDVGKVSYDFLVMATGSRPQFHGIPGAADCALTLNSLPDAIALRHHILDRVRRAVVEPEPRVRTRLLTFVIVGGGPTGVELAGGLVEELRSLLDRRGLFSETRVILVHSRDRLLPNFPESSGEFAGRHLRKLGVCLSFNHHVEAVNPHGVELDDGSAIAADTVIWTAGVEADLAADPETLPTARKNKISVNPTLQLPDDPNVYAIGDVAHVESGDRVLVGVAPEAMQGGEAVADNILRQLRGKSPRPFQYEDKGRAAIIARNAGVVNADRLDTAGVWGWLGWLAIHLFYLPGGRNRLGAVYNWFRDYIWGSRFVGAIAPPYPEVAFLEGGDPASEFFNYRRKKRRSHLFSQFNLGIPIMNYIPLIGRTFLAVIFLQSAIGKIFSFADTQQMMGDRGLPIPALLLLGNIVFQLVGGLSLVLGYRTRWGALILILFLIPTTLVFHNVFVDPGEQIPFLKNLALIGSLMMVSYFGAGPVSLDHRRSLRHSEPQSSDLSRHL